MSAPAISTTVDAQSSINQVHVIGAGPVGLLLTALLQEVDGLVGPLYEKRREYTRTRMVQLAPYLLADSVEAYRTDAIDTDSIEAVFDPAGARRRHRVPAGDLPRPDGAAARLVAGLLPAERHRTVCQRPDRLARRRIRCAAHRASSRRTTRSRCSSPGAS